MWVLIHFTDSRLERAIKVLGLLVKCKEGREEMITVMVVLKFWLRFYGMGAQEEFNMAYLL